MKNRIAVISILALSASFVAAQKPSDWVKSKLNPVDVAKKVDNGILNLKGAYGEAVFRCDFKPGAGQMTLYNRIRDRKNFKIEAARVSDSDKDPVATETFFGYNGKYTFFSKETNFRPISAVQSPDRLITKQDPVSAWPRHFSQLMFTTLVTGKGAFTEYAAALMKPNSGYKVQVDTRVMQGNNRTFKQCRLLAVRNTALAKKLGSNTVEIVIDQVRWIPLQVRSTEVSPKGVRANFEWTCWWKGPMRFDDKLFQVPKSAKVSLVPQTRATAQ